MTEFHCLSSIACLLAHCPPLQHQRELSDLFGQLGAGEGASAKGSRRAGAASPAPPLLRGGSASPMAASAARTRSRDSATALSANPTILNATTPDDTYA